MISLRPEQYHWHHREFLSRACVIQQQRVRVYAATLQEEPVEESAVTGTLIHLLEVVEGLQLEPEVECVNRDLVLAGVVLQQSGQEALREEEGRHPVSGRLAFQEPHAQELNALLEVLDPGRERIERRVGVVGP